MDPIDEFVELKQRRRGEHCDHCNCLVIASARNIVSAYSLKQNKAITWLDVYFFFSYTSLFLEFTLAKIQNNYKE